MRKVLNIFIGTISGIVSALGIGGGTILILSLSLFMGIDQHTAQSANLIFFIPTAIVSIIMNFRSRLIKWKTGLVIIFFGVIGAVIGAQISISLNTSKLKLFFGLFLLGIAIFEAYTLLPKKRE